MKREMGGVWINAEGSAIIEWTKWDADAGMVRWSELHERVLRQNCVVDFTGELGLYSRSLSGGLYKLLTQAYSISCVAQSPLNGSENSRKLGLSVGYLRIGVAEDQYITIPSVSCIASDYFYNPTYNWTYKELMESYDRRCDLNIKKIIEAKKPKVDQNVAA